MNKALKKSVHRAPRYVLDAGDENLVRVASKLRKGQIHNLEIVDVSESGMSFVVNWNFLPRIGEILKVEFPIPGAAVPNDTGVQHRAVIKNKVAWFARVVRLEGQNERPSDLNHFSGIKVAVEFVDMPQGHLQKLKMGLSRRVLERLHDRKKIQVSNNQSEYLRFILQIIFFVSMGFGIYFFFQHFTQEDLSYNSKKPVNWGERFFDKAIKKPSGQ